VCTLPPVCKCACPGTDVNYSLHETQMPAPDQLSAHGTAADVPSELDTSDMTEEHDTVSKLYYQVHCVEVNNCLQVDHSIQL